MAKYMEVYDYVREWVIDEGRGPSLHTIAREFEISSSSAASHITTLVRKGLVRRVKCECGGTMLKLSESHQ